MKPPFVVLTIQEADCLVLALSNLLTLLDRVKGSVGAAHLIERSQDLHDRLVAAIERGDFL